MDHITVGKVYSWRDGQSRISALGESKHGHGLRILDEYEIKPHRIRYYLERRDPEFDSKIREVLTVYQEVFLQNALPAKAIADAALTVITVSVDEKPGIQAIATVAPDLPPVAGRMQKPDGTMNTCDMEH